MPRLAFIDAATKRLKCHGYIDANDPGDEAVPVPDGFGLNPAEGWRWDGTTWLAFPFPAGARRIGLDLLDAKLTVLPAGPVADALRAIRALL